MVPPVPAAPGLKATPSDAIAEAFSFRRQVEPPPPDEISPHPAAVSLFGGLLSEARLAQLVLLEARLQDARELVVVLLDVLLRLIAGHRLRAEFGHGGELMRVTLGRVEPLGPPPGHHDAGNAEAHIESLADHQIAVEPVRPILLPCAIAGASLALHRFSFHSFNEQPAYYSNAETQLQIDAEQQQPKQAIVTKPPLTSLTEKCAQLSHLPC